MQRKGCPFHTDSDQLGVCQKEKQFRLSDLNNLYRAHVEDNSTGFQQQPVRTYHKFSGLWPAATRNANRIFSVKERKQKQSTFKNSRKSITFDLEEKHLKQMGYQERVYLLSFFFFKSILINQEWALNYWRTVPTFRTKIKQNGKQITSEQKHHLRDDTLAVFSGLLGTQE